MSNIKIQNLTKRYGDMLALNDVSLTIESGEFLILLGPSGCGKTTLLRCIAGLEIPDEGQIIIGDKVIFSSEKNIFIPPGDRNLGMVFQSYALWPHMTVRDNMKFGLDVMKMPVQQADKRLAKVLTDLGMSELRDRYPSELSGGQQQRVALARALVFEPDLVLMDEPLGALDKNLREQMQYEIKHIHENLGMTVVYVTHDQTEALTMSDRIAVFNEGVIQQLAPPNELYEKPENAFVADFIGENNRLAGTIKETNGSECLVVVEEAIITATNVHEQPEGSSVILSLRPERVVLNPEVGALKNIFEAEVLELIYLGDHVRCRMSICTNDDFVVKIPNDYTNISLNRGDVVKIGWQVTDCRALNAT